MNTLLPRTNVYVTFFKSFWRPLPCSSTFSWTFRRSRKLVNLLNTPDKYWGPKKTTTQILLENLIRPKIAIYLKWLNMSYIYIYIICLLPRRNNIPKYKFIQKIDSMRCYIQFNIIDFLLRKCLKRFEKYFLSVCRDCSRTEWKFVLMPKYLYFHIQELIAL